MRLNIGLVLMAALLNSCKTTETRNPMIGTWELISATTTEKDSTFSTFNRNHKMLKIINPTHFAFLTHDLNAGKDSSTAMFTAGGGAYTLADSIYTEHLEYFITREWESHTFQFVIQITNDTLIQKGVEKVEKLGVDRVIIEKYKRVTK